MNRRRWFSRALLGVWVAVALAALAPSVLAQQPDDAPAADPPVADAPLDGASPSQPEIDTAILPMQTYSDPAGRFGLVAPSRWGRLPSASSDEVVFESDMGDSIRVSIEPLKVDERAFAKAYVDTYLKVLGQSFANVRYIGQREVTVGFRKATDYVFSATFDDTPATCHQVVLFGGDKVLYVTFAAFGATRSQAEQLFETSLLSLWVGSSFGGATTATVSDPNAPAYVLAIPEGWVDQGPGDGNSHVFRPPNSHQTSAFISTRVTKLASADQSKTVDDAFVAAYAATVKSRYPENAFEMRQTRKLFLGGVPAVRYDYGYISNFGIRRGLLVLCVRNGYLVGITCDSAEQSYSLYDAAFEGLVTAFKFK